MLAPAPKVLRFLPAVLVLLLGTGCSEKTVTVSGKVVLPSKIKLTENDSTMISFVPTTEGKKGSQSGVNPTDLSFTVNNLPPGKYKITLKIDPYPGQDLEKRTTQLEPINEQYNTTAKTKLEYEVTNEPQQTITVDVAKGTVTKG